MTTTAEQAPTIDEQIGARLRAARLQAVLTPCVSTAWSRAARSRAPICSSIVGACSAVVVITAAPAMEVAHPDRSADTHPPCAAAKPRLSHTLSPAAHRSGEYPCRF